MLSDGGKILWFFGFNLILFFALFTGLILNWFSGVFLILTFFGITLSLHNHFNIVHMASHQMVSKNRLINKIIGNISAILGGITFADFRTTHVIHHAKQGQKFQDPDYWITKAGSIWTIPFRIFYHDYFFFKNGLAWKQNNWQGYFASRLIQGTLITSLVVAGRFELWLYFWLLPIFVVGFLNGLFLFYFPHYTIKLEDKLRLKIKDGLQVNLLAKLALLLIDVSRWTHEKHHDNIRTLIAYFPILWVSKLNIQGLWKQELQSASGKYLS